MKKFITNPFEKIEVLQKKIITEGVVFFESELTTDSLLNQAKKLGSIYKHRDSHFDGITVIKSVYAPKETKSGYFGFTNSYLSLHTDRSTLKVVPNILIFYCKTNDCVGGESILVDGKDLINYFQTKYSETNCPLFYNNSVIFSDNSSFYKGSIFEKIGNKSYQLRFRNDEFSFFNPNVHSFLQEFYEVMEDKKVEFKLKKNQGYIINNNRYLHGRKGFNGKREM